jgi:hypothetical protein
MKKSEIRGGFYYSDGGKTIEIISALPNRPDTFLAKNEDREELKIKEDKIYKLRLNENWLKDLGFGEGRVFMETNDKKSWVKKTGPTFYIHEQDRESDGVSKKLVMSVHELQDYYFQNTGKVPTLENPVKS